MIGIVFACALCFGIGCSGLVMPRRPAVGVPEFGLTQKGFNRLVIRRIPRVAVRRMVVGALVGLGTALATGWPAALLVGGLAGYGLPGLFARTSGGIAIGTIEAIATWTEMLQGTLASSAGMSQAIAITAPLAPLPIRAATTALANRLSAGIVPSDALVEFGNDLDDASADRVVCALLVATSSRTQRIGDLLVALAESTRDEVALRLRVETSRASVRSGVRTVLLFSVAFACGLGLLAHGYLAPFGSRTGQLVLLAVGGLYAGGMALMVSLSQPPPSVRLLGHDVVDR